MTLYYYLVATWPINFMYQGKEWELYNPYDPYNTITTPKQEEKKEEVFDRRSFDYRQYICSNKPGRKQCHFLKCTQTRQLITINSNRFCRIHAALFDR